VNADRSYSGPPLDGTYQSISEAPHWQGDGKTVDVVDDEPVGRESTTNVPIPVPEPDAEPDLERPDRSGQTTWDDWGGSQ